MENNHTMKHPAGPTRKGRDGASLRKTLIIALMITVALAGIMDHDLWTPDEPREAAIALSMSRSGNLIVPELAGQPFVEKPPLFYIIASYFLLGLGPFLGYTAALRLVPACFGLGTLLMTYLLAKVYHDRQNALMAAAMLATMLGFVDVTHWLLVDNALMFFVVASIWTLAEVYERNRTFFLIPAGLFVACAFLTKGFIGPMIIFLAWIGLFMSRIKRPEPKVLSAGTSVTYHAIALIIAVMIPAGWAAFFYNQAGPDLFKEWWWTNHFGRFTGQSTHLGHISPWYYYFPILPVFILPWLAPFLGSLGICIHKALRKQALPADAAMLAMWIFGALALFSLSATKREIYLCVLLPGCAIFCIHGLEWSLAGLANKVYWLWIIMLGLAAAAAAALPPVFSSFFDINLHSGGQQIPVVLGLIAGALTIRSLNRPFLQRFLICTLLLYATLLTVFLPAMDALKSYGPAFRTATDAINCHPRINIAAWNLDETTRAGLYYYGNLTFPSLDDDAAAKKVLLGRHPRFNAVLTLTKKSSPNDLPCPPSQVIFEIRMGKRRILRLLAAPGWEQKCGTKVYAAMEMKANR